MIIILGDKISIKLFYFFFSHENMTRCIAKIIQPLYKIPTGDHEGEKIIISDVPKAISRC